jgi:serine/threonine protein kinase
MPGILPIIAYDLPRSPTRRSPPWLAMREATRLRENLGDNPSLREVVVSISAVAGTLADLAERGVFHRDLKPDNLFHLDGRAVVGDFGLATFPGKPAQTVAGPKLGPLFYIAQEMLESPEEAKPGPADVFSAQSQKYSGF